jgi:DNA-binding XRE family transcriptional regulator
MAITTPEQLGAAVRGARVQHAWSQEDLADRIGVTREWVGRLEKGSPRLEFDKVLRVAIELGFELRVPAEVEGLQTRPQRVSTRARKQAMAEIEKGQQLAGHQPSAEALERARRVLDGTLTVDAANAELDAKYHR